MYNDLILHTNEQLGINEKACPNCRSKIYGLVDYPICEELLIYKSKKFHKKDRATIKHIKRCNIYEFINEEEFE